LSKELIICFKKITPIDKLTIGSESKQIQGYIAKKPVSGQENFSIAEQHHPTVVDIADGHLDREE